MGLDYGITVILRFSMGFLVGTIRTQCKEEFFFFLGMGFLVGTGDELLISLLIS